MIATRLMKLRIGTAEVDVPIHISAPQRAGKAWACRYEIAWPDGKREAAAGGMDSMQALLSALQMISAELYTSDHHKSGSLFWDRPGSGYGFPVTQNLRDLLIGDDAEYL